MFTAPLLLSGLASRTNSAAIKHLLSITVCVFACNYAWADVQLHWQDQFSAQEQQKLTAWIEQTDAALTRLVGRLPFTKHIYFHRLESASEPVPWAHTERSTQQRVHFYVDPRYAKEVFLDDWTAPHELSHLVMPYVGKRNAWFAEGFASYMQYQVMQEMGVLNAIEVKQQYQRRFAKAQRSYSMPHMPFTQAAAKLRKQRQFPTMYWGGAIYFRQVDNWLHAHKNSNLAAVLRNFVACCRMRTQNFSALIRQLDRTSSSAAFTSQLTYFQTKLGFPNYENPLVIDPQPH